MLPELRHDSRQRRRRRLDTCQYQTIVECWVPRVKCEEHGVLQVPVPWAESNSRFTALFEKHVIEWLHEAGMSAVARKLDLSWGQVDRIMKRAVERGLARREHHAPRRIGIDETSFQKRHEYVTVVLDQETGVVLHVATAVMTKRWIPITEGSHRRIWRQSSACRWTCGGPI